MANTDSRKIIEPSSGSKEYEKKESGRSEVPKNPAQSPGTTSPTADDVANGDANDQSGKPSAKDKKIAEEIKNKSPECRD